MNKLSNKVVYDRKSNKYVGVFVDGYLRYWGQDDQDIKEGEETKVRRRVMVLFRSLYSYLLHLAVENGRGHNFIRRQAHNFGIQRWKLRIIGKLQKRI